MRGSQLVLLGKVVHHNPRQDDHVGPLAVEDALLLNRGEVITNCQLVARLLLEDRRKLVERIRQRDRGKHFHFGRISPVRAAAVCILSDRPFMNISRPVR